MTPKGILLERRGEWLFHTTSFDALLSIVRSHSLVPGDGDFVSFSREPWVFDITGTDAVLVFDKAAIRSKVLPVKYTEAWYTRWTEQASYIAGEGWREQYMGPDWLYDPPEDTAPEELEFWEPDPKDVDAAYREAELRSFLDKRLEREWVTRRPGPMKFQPKHLNRVLVLNRGRVSYARKLVAGLLPPEDVMARGHRKFKVRR